jgi:2-polyprenyl-6-methoxyphenol hydroxylase-like FAD-dependent oxidoreductase
MAARISNDGMWRVSYGEIPGLSPEELRARQPMKFEKMLPGHPKPGEYKLANFSPYKIHQRLAEKMRVGRFLLAADAAHLCNPL